jgi:phosphoribosylformylglycinamidine synthase subunit PurL
MKRIRKENITNAEYNALLSKYSCNEIFKKIIASPNICSKKWVWEQYDHMVQTNTAILPGHDGAVIRIKDKDKALAFSSDGNGRYCYLNPFMGGIIAVCESVRNLACSGAITMAITDCLNFGTPEKPEIFWQLKRTMEGMSKACDHLDVPVVSGNVSLYNESFGNPIYPTPVVVGAGLIRGIRNITSNAFKNEDDLIILLGKNKDNMGGTEFMSLFFDRIAGNCPTLDLKYEKRLHKLILKLIEMDIIHSAHDCSVGGIGIAIAESAILGGLGANIEIDLLMQIY